MKQHSLVPVKQKAQLSLRDSRSHVIYHRDNNNVQFQKTAEDTAHCCLGGEAVRRRARDRKVAGLIPGRGAIKSTRSTQPFIPSG